MKEFTSSGIGFLNVAGKTNLGEKNTSRSQSFATLKRLFEGLKASFNASFESDWEKKTGLPWKDWGKM